MSDIQHSIGNRGRDPQDRLNDPIYVAQMQQKKEGQNGAENLQNPQSKIFHFAAALFGLKKFIGEFRESSKMRSASLNKQKTLEDLAAFKTVLEELGREDKSHDPEFTQRLSLLWQNLYENCSGLEDKISHLDALAARIMNFVRQITQFPPGEDHTLGYYLTEHAGQEWIPFPFMNLLAELHEGYLTSPDTSQLSLWIKELAEILGSYESNPF